MAAWRVKVSVACFACGKDIEHTVPMADPDSAYRVALSNVGDGIVNVNGGLLDVGPGEVVTLCKWCYEKGKMSFQNAIMVTEEPVVEKIAQPLDEA